ncbi:TetR/AcrR family transcriptional regulator [Saccharibacillus kuerlensis]|uniref:TetR family transcriptional regulator n=1 Tax=Saccharibacillus kuerlensis TaxID=459527 RepID=A0ABQ2KUY7_9BACL|nr:TetR/AcrR family transcriptional regulator [Saccharibacillus kuerlensis]GGN91174.1 TetR family transcriptional regulator [Saccharibacillus kuerlensis]
MRTRAFDEEQALDAAMRVFWEKGYQASSLSDLTDRMNIRKPSLYAAFGDKRELFDRALDRYMRKHAIYMQQLLDRESKVIPAFEGLLLDLAAGGCAGDPALGCLIVLTIDELAPSEPEWTAKAREHQLCLAGLFRDKIAGGLVSGELAPGQNAEALGNALLTSVIGLTIMLKTMPDATFIETTIASILTMFQQGQS